MEIYKTDNLSYFLGKFDQDCYLIARGVRMLGSHLIEEKDFNKIKNNILEIADGHHVKSKIIIDKELINIIIYHPTEGKKWLDKLEKLDEELKESEDNKKLESIFKKIIHNKSLNSEEKEYLRKYNKLSEEIDRKFGEIFGYSDASIRRSLE